MMKQLLITLLIPISVHAYMTPGQIQKEMKEPGHIPQGLKPSPYHPLDEVIPKSEQQKLKQKKKAERKQRAAKLVSIDLRAFDSPIREQWDGTCTAHGLIASMENLFNRANPTFLSTRYFWSLYRQYNAKTAMLTAKRHAQVDNDYWPQNNNHSFFSDLKQYGAYKLTEARYLEEDPEAAIDALQEKHPVYVAMQVPADMSACRAAIRPTTKLVNGGHAMAIVGYEPGAIDYFILKNSWGTECGDQGYQYFPVSLCKRDDMYCMFWSIEEVTDLKK